MTVVLVPWRGGDTYRDTNWESVRRHLRTLWLPIVTGDREGPWNRAAAINAAARSAGDWDVAYIADADTLDDLETVQRAIDAVQSSKGGVVPWNKKWNLSEEGTRQYLADGVLDKDRIDKNDHTPPKLNVFMRGGAIVVHREAWDIAGGFDEGFTEWGYEDIAFREVVCTLAKGKLRELRSECVHLWHPSNRLHSAVGRERYTKYNRARNKPDKMRAVLEELGQRDHQDQGMGTDDASR